MLYLYIRRRGQKNATGINFFFKKFIISRYLLRAEVILAHPDHPILLAGTMATNSTQEECVDLFNRRAAAVKELLVSAFGVPESELQSVGLGYEADPFVRGKDRNANDHIAQELLGA